MATYGFYERYVSAIRAGTKNQTIRRVRKYPPKVGAELRLKCKGELFGTANIIEVYPIAFRPDATDDPARIIYLLSQHPMHGFDLEKFAQRDGFDNSKELFKELRKYSTDKTDWNEFLVIRWEDYQDA